MQTPNDPRTPGPYMDTPGHTFRSPGQDPNLGGFTPTPAPKSPGYLPIDKSVVYPPENKPSRPTNPFSPQ